MVKLDWRTWLGFLSSSRNLDCRNPTYLPRCRQKGRNYTALTWVALGKRQLSLDVRWYQLWYRCSCSHKNRCALHPNPSCISMNVELSSLSPNKSTYACKHACAHARTCDKPSPGKSAASDDLQVVLILRGFYFNKGGAFIVNIFDSTADF